MILKALVDYYDQLLREGKVARPGWCTKQIKFVLEIDEAGELVNIVSQRDERGTPYVVPEQVKRSVNVAANFLCDNSSYLLGVDGKGNPERSKRCFDAACELHHTILDGVESPCARAVVAFFDGWDVESALVHPAIARCGDALFAGANLIFSVRLGDGRILIPSEDEPIKGAWERHLSLGDDDTDMTCLVTGENGPIARLHPALKGIVGAQSSGATLVGFNASAFESFGHTQGENAPVGVRAAQAYGAALNWLLASPTHRVRLGDTTVVYWSERCDEQNSLCMSELLGGRGVEADNDAKAIDQRIDAVMRRLASGEHVDAESIDTSAPFYVLGLAPNAARVSVRFFMRGEFGSVLANLRRHYERLAIVHGPSECEYVTPYWLLKAVENENSKHPVISSELSASLLRAILQGGRYPEALYQNALIRIRASRRVTRERAAIIKAYLLNNQHKTREEITVGVNVERNETAYTLGRAFSLLEQIQERANGTATITDRYLASACATPAIVFPVLLKLSATHLKKIERDSPGLAGYFSRQLEDAFCEENVTAFPKHLSLADQGDFFLGYYHQRQARYAKKDAAFAAKNDLNDVSDTNKEG